MTRPGGAVERYAYNASGELVSHQDARGNTTSFAFDGRSRLTSTTDPSGVETTIHPRPDGLIDWVENDRHDRVAYGYDAAGNQSSVCRPGVVGCSTVSFDALGRPVTQTDGSGRSTAISYEDAAGRVVITPPGQGSTVREYNAAGDLVSEVDPTGVRTDLTWKAPGLVGTISVGGRTPSEYFYDTRGAVIGVRAPDGGLTVFGYDADGRQVSVTSPLGEVTRSVLDSVGNPVRVVDPAGNTWVRGYDAAGRVSEVRDPLGHATSYRYDAAGNVLSVTDAKAHTTSFTYDELGRRDKTIDARGKSTRTVFDEVGRVDYELGADGSKVDYSWDAAGRLVSVTEPRGFVPGANPGDYTTTFGYDDADRRIRVSDALGNATTTGYDPAGRVNLVTAADGSARSWTYDGAGRVESVTTLGDGGVTSYGYDGHGDLVSMTDPRGNVTLYRYDTSHRVVGSTDPLGYRSATRFDLDGRVGAVVDSNGFVADPTGDTATVTYRYDPRGMVAAVDYTDASTPDVSFSYDDAGRQVKMLDGVGEERASFDEASRLTALTRGGVGFSYEYNPANQVTRRVLPNGTAVSEERDDAGRVSSVVSGSQSVTFGYLPGGLSDSISRSNGTTESYVWDRVGRLTSWSALSAGGTAFASESRSYDEVGLPEVSATSAGSSTFTYDERNRLASESWQPSAVGTAGGAPDAGVSGFDLDVSGNVTSRSVVGGAPESVGYNGVDQPDAGVSGAPVVYDANGQLLSDGRFRYSWNAAGRLVNATQIGVLDGQVSAPDAVMADNPAAYWRLGQPESDGSWANEVAGVPSMVAPSSNAPTAVDEGVVTPDDGAFMFDGNDSVSIKAASPQFAMNSSFTIEWWQQLPAATIFTKPVMRLDTEGWGIEQTAGSGQLRYRRGPLMFQTGVSVSDGVTHHFRLSFAAATPGGSTGTLVWWVDGVATASVETTLTQLSSGSSVKVVNTASGLMDELAMFDVSSDELSEHRSAVDYPGAVLADHPFGYWRFGEPQGSFMATDSSGHGFDATIPQYRVPSAVARGAVLPDDGALSFDGIDDVVKAVASPAFDLAGAHTIEFWARSDVDSGSSEMLLSKGVSQAGKGGWQISRNVQGRLVYKRNGRAYESSASGVIGSDWTHVALVFDGSTVSWFVNGVLDVARPLVGGPFDAPSEAGVTMVTGGSSYAGVVLDEVALYDTAIPGGHWGVATAAGGVSVTYGYDGRGGRVTGSARTVTGASVGSMPDTRWWWDINRGLAEVAQIDTAGSSRVVVSGPAGPVMSEAGGVWESVHTDSFGSIVGVSSSSGGVVGTATYGPYGEQRSGSGQIGGWAQRFGGGSVDAVTGLVFLRARYLDPGSAMFLSRDPVRPGVGAPYQSPYTYVYGNPTVASDPTGLVPEWKKDGFLPAAAGILASVACGVVLAPTVVGVALCAGIGGAVRAAMSGCFYGQSMAYCFANVAKSATIDAAMGVATYGVGKLLSPLWRAVTGVGRRAVSGIASVVERSLGRAGTALRKAGTEFGESLRTFTSKLFGRVCRSFGRDTNVLMADGSAKPISLVRVGDRVRVSDPKTGRSGAGRVVATLPHTDRLSVLRTSAGDVLTTEDHLYWNATDSRWEHSQDLDRGDRLQTPDGSVVTVIGLDWATARIADAYDLDVEDVDTFYVQTGDDWVLVHNQEACPLNLAADATEFGGLSEVSPGVYRSPQGLTYGPGSAQGHRVTHVMEHARPVSGKPVHSVFQTTAQDLPSLTDEVLGIVDDAWAIRGPAVTGDPGKFVVPMGRTVGTAGETSVTIIVKPGTSEIITAWPS